MSPYLGMLIQTELHKFSPQIIEYQYVIMLNLGMNMGQKSLNLELGVITCESLGISFGEKS